MGYLIGMAVGLFIAGGIYKASGQNLIAGLVGCVIGTIVCIGIGKAWERR